MSENYAPTRTSLLQLKEELLFANEGYEILDHKKEILLREFISLSTQLKSSMETFHTALAEQQNKFYNLKFSFGQHLIRYLSYIKPESVIISFEEKHSMGVHLKTLKIEKSNLSNIAIEQKDKSIRDFFTDMEKFLPVLLQHIELEVACKKLTAEITKTQQREKALENIHIPFYKKNISQITSKLEENELEELIRYKKLKKKTSARLKKNTETDQ